MIGKAVVAGHVCLDVIPHMDREFDLLPGRLYEVGSALMATGGVVSNTGVALHLLGIPTVLMGKVGEDSFGKSILEIFEGYSPDLTMGMRIDPRVVSSYSIVINIPGRDRAFLHCPGANHTFGVDDIDYEQTAGAALFHFGYPPLMAATYANDGEQLESMFKRVKEGRTATSLDMAMPDPGSTSGKADWQRILARTLPHVDIFLPSADELLYMIDRDAYGLGDDLDGARISSLGERLLEMGVAIGGVKLGSRGLYFRTADRERLAKALPFIDAAAWADRELWFPIYKVPMVGATGAGDTTIAGFLASLLRGLSPEEAGTMANKVGAMNVQAADALSGLRDWETTRATMAQVVQVPVEARAEGWRLADGGFLIGPADARR